MFFCCYRHWKYGLSAFFGKIVNVFVSFFFKRVSLWFCIFLLQLFWTCSIWFPVFDGLGDLLMPTMAPTGQPAPISLVPPSPAMAASKKTVKRDWKLIIKFDKSWTIKMNYPPCSGTYGLITQAIIWTWYIHRMEYCVWVGCLVRSTSLQPHEL